MTKARTTREFEGFFWFEEAVIYQEAIVCTCSEWPPHSTRRQRALGPLEVGVWFADALKLDFSFYFVVARLCAPGGFAGIHCEMPTMS